MKLTQKHFELFRTECEKRLEQLGLKGWKVFYQFKPLNEIFAKCEWSYSGWVATITLAVNFPKPFDNLEALIKETALHECLELFLAPLTSLAQSRAWDREEFEKETHSVIRTLEKVLFIDNR